MKGLPAVIMILIVWIQGLAKQTPAEHNGNKFIIGLPLGLNDMKRTRQNKLSNHRKKKVSKSAQYHEQNQTPESNTEESVQLPRKKVRWEGNSESVAAVADTENGSSDDDARTSKVTFSRYGRVP